MKIFYQTLTTAFIAVFLLSFCTANAQTVNFDDAAHPGKATSITGLTVAGSTYDVSFDLNEANNVYGAFPGTYTFSTYATAEDAVDAMNAALNEANALKVGQVDGAEFPSFYIGYEGSGDGPSRVEWCNWDAGTFIDATWTNINGGVWTYNGDSRNYTVFTLVTGVNEELEGTPISIYPNPATNVLNIEISKDIQQVSLFNPAGQMVFKQSVESGKTSIDLEGFKSGLYFVRIHSGESSVTRKVIIQ